MATIPHRAPAGSTTGIRRIWRVCISSLTASTLSSGRQQTGFAVM